MHISEKLSFLCKDIFIAAPCPLCLQTSITYVTYLALASDLVLDLGFTLPWPY